MSYRDYYWPGSPKLPEDGEQVARGANPKTRGLDFSTSKEGAEAEG